MKSGASRYLTLLVAAAVVTILLPAPASGWSNGVDGCNSFGTHDWILDSDARPYSLTLRALSVGNDPYPSHQRQASAPHRWIQSTNEHPGTDVIHEAV